MNPRGAPDMLDFRADKKNRGLSPLKGHMPLLHFQEALKLLRSDPVLKEARGAVKRQGLYLVGGVLRNLALGRPLPPDYDFVYDGRTALLAGKFASRLGGSAFILDKETLSYRVAARVNGAPCTIDISSVKDGGISCDLKSRDFTVDALAVGVAELFTEDAPRLFDPCGGLDDAACLRLRMNSRKAFLEDPLRCLRAVRIARQYGLKITPDTAAAVKKASPLLTGVAPERVREELTAIFRCVGASRAVSALYYLGVIKAILPEALHWRDAGGVEPPQGYDLLAHSLKTLDEGEAVIDEAMDTAGKAFPGLAENLSRHFLCPAGSLDRKVFFKMAAFFHDAGKPLTVKLNPLRGRTSGKLSFKGHDREGAVLINGIFRRLRFSGRVAAEIANLVKNHHRIFALAKLKKRSDRAKAHLLRAADGVDGIWKGAAVDLLLLSVADVRATRGGEDRRFLKFVNEMLRFYYEHFLKKRAAPLMNGREIMRVFKIPEGPLVGEIIKKISEGIEAGVVKDKKEAKAYVRKRLKAAGC
ncbi:MAG: HD domain-containing protein [Deltaproteobacteria bacterium]|nr:HD domain-containing protein [Deltaproteobacteria bacterium]